MVMPSGEFRVSMGVPAAHEIEWAWTESLAMARPGMTYRIAQIPLSAARARCAKLGCDEGQVVRCTGNGGGMVVLERPDGQRVLVENYVASFVQAELCVLGGPGPH